MNKFEFFRELYHKENDRRTEVLNSINIPIAIISALSTALYFVITTFEYKVEIFSSYIFCGLCVAAIICILFAIYYLIRAFSNFDKGYEYSGIPYPNELYSWYKELEEYFTTNNGTIEDADKHFQDYLMSNFTKHADHNMFVNDRKHEHIYMSKKCLIAGLTLTIILMLPFCYNYFKKKETIYKIEISYKSSESSINIVEFKKNLEQMIQFNQLKKNQMSENENKKIPPPPPPPPPNDRLIKEGQEPPKPKGEKK
jgi:hypothetical protein